MNLTPARLLTFFAIAMHSDLRNAYPEVQVRVQVTCPINVSCFFSVDIYSVNGDQNNENIMFNVFALTCIVNHVNV